MVKVTFLFMFLSRSSVSPLKNFFHSNSSEPIVRAISSILIHKYTDIQYTYCIFPPLPSPCDQFTSKTANLPELTDETQTSKLDMNKKHYHSRQYHHYFDILIHSHIDSWHIDLIGLQDIGLLYFTNHNGRKTMKYLPN